MSFVVHTQKQLRVREMWFIDLGPLETSFAFIRKCRSRMNLPGLRSWQWLFEKGPVDAT